MIPCTSGLIIPFDLTEAILSEERCLPGLMNSKASHGESTGPFVLIFIVKRPLKGAGIFLIQTDTVPSLNIFQDAARLLLGKGQVRVRPVIYRMLNKVSTIVY